MLPAGFLEIIFRRASNVQYDEVGNIRYKSGLGEYVYGAERPNAVLKADDNQIVHNDNGQIVEMVGRKIEYNVSGNISKVTNSNGTEEYVYGYNGQRVIKNSTDGAACVFGNPN